MQRTYGWQRQEPDHRDYQFLLSRRRLLTLPHEVDLEPYFPLPATNQGNLGSCGPNAAWSLITFDQKIESRPVITPSRLFMYFTTRRLMGTIAQDSGVTNRAMLKALNQSGFCNESVWPYDISKYAVRPPKIDFARATANRVVSYATVPQTLDMMRGCLAGGYPFLFGFDVFKQFESDQAAADGIIAMPKRGETPIGGHDVTLMGFNDATGYFKFRNSYGKWGKHGYGLLPYSYATDINLAGDFWVINAVPGGIPKPPLLRAA